ncbi:MAG: hypothetical protein IPI34_02880 [bacterium]|nr:hypothetical protein [bacterium]
MVAGIEAREVPHAQGEQAGFGREQHVGGGRRRHLQDAEPVAAEGAREHDQRRQVQQLGRPLAGRQHAQVAPEAGAAGHGRAGGFRRISSRCRDR